MTGNDGDPAGGDAAIDEGALFDQHVTQSDAGPVTRAPDENAPKPDAGQDGPARDPQGRFAPKSDELDPAKVADVSGRDAKPSEASKTGELEKPAITGVMPPKGWSPAEKDIFAGATPPTFEQWELVKQAIARREDEMSVGMKRYEGMARWADEAERHGFTLSQRAEYLTRAEQFIEQDFVGAMMWMAGNKRIPIERLVADLNARASGQQGNGASGAGAVPQGAQPSAPPIDFRSIISEHMQTERDTEASTAFFTDPANRYAENVRPMMAALIRAEQVPALKRGAPMSEILREAYDMECQADPQIRPLVQKTTTSTTQGAPSAGQRPQARELTPEQKRATGSITGAPLKNGRSAPAANDRAAESELYDEFVGRA